MNRGIILFLAATAVLGLLALYALQQGPVLLLRAPSGQRIAFVSDRGGSPNLWTMRADGTDPRQVTNDEADDQVPAWSPNAKEIVSVSDRNGQVYQVFVSAWDGRYTRALTSSEGTKNSPIWTPDGSAITFISGGKVGGIARTGGREELFLPPGGITSLELPGRSTYDYAAWSPDGKMLLYVLEADQGREACVVGRDALDSYEGGNLEALGIAMAENMSVAWSPAGSRIAVSTMNGRGKNTILVADVEAVGAKPVHLAKPGTGPGKVAWSPDGKSIAFELWKMRDGAPNRSLGIYTVSADGGAPRLVVSGDARDPGWSPDGKRLAYTMMGKNERRDIWVVNADGAGAANVTNGKGDNSSPAWSPTPGRRR